MTQWEGHKGTMNVHDASGDPSRVLTQWEEFRATTMGGLVPIRLKRFVYIFFTLTLLIPTENY
jgi:hypothetical protein